MLSIYTNNAVAVTRTFLKHLLDAHIVTDTIDECISMLNILNAKNLAPPVLSIFSGSKSMTSKINNI